MGSMGTSGCQANEGLRKFISQLQFWSVQPLQPHNFPPGLHDILQPRNSLQPAKAHETLGMQTFQVKWRTSVTH